MMDQDNAIPNPSLIQNPKFNSAMSSLRMLESI